MLFRDINELAFRTCSSEYFFIGSMFGRRYPYNNLRRVYISRAFVRIIDLTLTEHSSMFFSFKNVVLVIPTLVLSSPSQFQLLLMVDCLSVNHDPRNVCLPTLISIHHCCLKRLCCKCKRSDPRSKSQKSLFLFLRQTDDSFSRVGNYNLKEVRWF